MKKLVLAVLVFMVVVGNASERTQEIPDKNQMHQAMKECFNSVSKDDQGHPDRDAMDQCMEDKGFTKPEGMPEQGDHQGSMPPPPR